MVAQGLRLILASNSPRRKELLAGIDVPFEVRIIDGIDESYPSDMPTKDIAGYISSLKRRLWLIVTRCLTTNWSSLPTP